MKPADTAAPTRTAAAQVRPRRARLEGVSTNGGASIELVLGEQSLHGASPVQGSVAEAVAVATLDALEPLVPDGTELRLDSLATTPAGEDLTILTVVVVVGTNGDGDPHVGTALVRDTEGEAAARAVLDALNRLVALDAA